MSLAAMGATFVSIGSGRFRSLIGRSAISDQLSKADDFALT
jgi:hypothetical protein